MSVEKHRRKLAESASVWIEMTKTSHNHGGVGWEFGKCLWSPASGSSNADIYSMMRVASRGDGVLHFLEDTWPDGVNEVRLAGTSKIAHRVVVREDAPPEPGTWGGRESYYRIELVDFDRFDTPLSVRTLRGTYAEELRAEILEDRPRHFPFVIYRDEIRTGQGNYLTRATPRLLNLMLDALGIEDGGRIGGGETKSGANPHDEYVDGQRRRREANYFARNPALVRDAKIRDRFQCQICQFKFEDVYGAVGRDFIECHHLNPLAEQPRESGSAPFVTRLDEVISVCSNCHRMVHRRRPAYSPDEIRSLLLPARDS